MTEPVVGAGESLRAALERIVKIANDPDFAHYSSGARVQNMKTLAVAALRAPGDAGPPVPDYRSYALASRTEECKRLAALLADVSIERNALQRELEALRSPAPVAAPEEHNETD